MFAKGAGDVVVECGVAGSQDSFRDRFLFDLSFCHGIEKCGSAVIEEELGRVEGV